MIDTEYVTKNEVRDVVFRILKENKIVPQDAVQSKLVLDDPTLDDDYKEYLEDKQCLVWLASNEKGERQGIKCNQFYISKKGSMRVDKAIPLFFEEVFDIWELYFKGHDIEDIYLTSIFDSYDVGISDVCLVIYCLITGKCDFMLEFINENRYSFDFKKYKGKC